jgi:predicted RNA binding protein YcfA (HicA-like mRNA interferase family)
VSPRQPVVSGERLIKALANDGWSVVRQRGSHVRLKKPERRTALVVPLHKEIRKGTLAGILRDADLSPNDLRRLLR